MLDQHITQDVEPPTRSLVQRMEALEKANHVRIVRANFKKELKRGTKTRKDVFMLILEPSEDFATMKLGELLLSCRGFGVVKVNNILKKCLISNSKTVGGLSSRQRAEVTSWVL